MSSGFRPLDGVRIIEFSSSIAGPVATMILAQLGADVIKVESPQGDDARAWPPHVGDRSIVFRQMNVGKRGVVIDLKQAEGLEVALALTDTASVVLQTMRPGVVDRIGIGARAVRARNRDVIYFDMIANRASTLSRLGSERASSEHRRHRPRHAGLRSDGAGIYRNHGNDRT